jgi:imidazolonepropionase-like amidohydrolase
MKMRRTSLLVAGVLAAFASGAAAPPSRDKVSYKVLLVGNAAGVATTQAGPGGEQRFFFEFTDRGRGPKLETWMVLGADGAPILVEAQGNDYLKSPVTERFAVEKGVASWKNPSENGNRKVEGSAYYVSLNGVPQEAGLLAAALLRAPGRRLALLPDGEASIERVAERRVRAGSGERTVTLYAVSGLDFGPEFVWLDRDGTYFASASTWLTAVREGWEGAVPTLLEAQEAAESVRAKALAKAASRRPERAVVFRGANLFDSPTATSRNGMTVVVSGDRIAAVGPDGSVPVPEGAQVIDAAGRTLLPGLWDMHVHVSDLDGPLNIMAGVTSVRDLANDVDKLAALSRSWSEGSAIGPRVIAAGFIDGPGPYAGPTKVLVDTPEEARAAIARYASLGYPQIKVYSSIRPELVEGMIAAAHERGMRVSGHVPAFMTADQFVRLGADEIQHANFLFLNFWGDTVRDTRTPLRFTAVAQNAAELDLDSERVRAFLRLLKERGIVSDPTVSIFEEMFVGRPGTVSPGYAAVADRLPVQVRRGLLTGGLPVPEGSDQRYRDSFRAMLGMVRRLEAEGIPIVAGTDSLAGFTLDRELELYVEAGIPAPRVLQIATLGAARVMKRDAELGVIARGKLADLVLVEGDPSARISDVRRVVTVVKNGVIYDPDAISRALGIRPSAARH